MCGILGRILKLLVAAVAPHCPHRYHHLRRSMLETLVFFQGPAIVALAASTANTRLASPSMQRPTPAIPNIRALVSPMNLSFDHVLNIRVPFAPICSGSAHFLPAIGCIVLEPL